MSNPIDPIEIAAKAIGEYVEGYGWHSGDAAYVNALAHAVIAALEKAGWRLIKRDATVEMNMAAWSLVRSRWPKGPFLGTGPAFREAMQAMFDVAPTYTPPAEERK